MHRLLRTLITLCIALVLATLAGLATPGFAAAATPEASSDTFDCQITTISQAVPIRMMVPATETCSGVGIIITEQAHPTRFTLCGLTEINEIIACQVHTLETWQWLWLPHDPTLPTPDHYSVSFLGPVGSYQMTAYLIS